MLLQWEQTLFFILWFLLATVIVALIIFIVVILIESKTKASDKKFLIIILAIICVLIIPLILAAIDMVLGAIGGIFFYNENHLIRLTPIIGFLIILILVKYLLDVPWDHAVWVSLLTLFFLFLLYTIIPGLYEFLKFGL